MILAIDMGNSHIETGLMDGERVLLTERFATDPRKTATEYAVLLHTVLQIRSIDPADIEGAILSSVVPPLTRVLEEAVKKVTGLKTLVVGPGVKNGLKIRIDDPKTLGADLVVDAVGGIHLYGAPLAVIDMGTATTISVIDREGAFRGGAVMPGVHVSLSALVSSASLLPNLSLADPGKAIGTNTVDCMRSGIVYGQAAMIDGMLDRFAGEIGSEIRAVATGGLAPGIIPFCRHRILLDSELMLRGLSLIYDMNRRER